MAYIDGREILFSAVVTGGGGARVNLNAPSISLDLYTSTLTITDALNGNFVSGYKIYIDNTLITTVTNKTVVLTNYTELNEAATVKVCAVGENFIDSELATVEWTNPHLYAPTIAINNITDTLTITDTNGENVRGYAIYVAGELLATVTEKTVVLSQYMTLTNAKYVKVKALSNNVYFRDSGFSNSVLWMVRSSGTEGLVYSYEGSYAYCRGYGTATENSIVIASYYNGYPVTSIFPNSFSPTDEITSVFFPDIIQTIGYNSFRNCHNLTSIRLGLSVVLIGHNAFERCERLKDVYYAGTEDDWAKITIEAYNEDLTTATIHFNS